MTSSRERASEWSGELKELLLFERDLPARHRGGIESENVGDALFIIGDPVRFNPVFRELLETAVVREAARSLLGSDDLAVHFINVTIKHAHFGRAIGWHRDFPNPLYSTEGSDFLRLMLCLDGMDATSGATSFVSGSHHISDAEAIRQKVESAWPQPQEAEAHALHNQPGDIVAIHPKVLHGGGMNTSQRSRRNIVMQIGRADAPLTTTTNESMTGLRL